MSRGRYDRGPVAPKPFEYIPFADRVEKAPPAGHHRYDPELLTGYLSGEIVVLTPLHVASGGIELTERVAPRFARQTPLIKAFVRSGGVRVIPGSTLKGAVRSVVEAITPSTVGKVGRRTRLPRGELREPRGIKKNRPPSANPLSPADRMFGVMDYLGPVQFADAPQIGDQVVLVEQPSLYAPRTRGPVKGRKFYKHGRPAEGNVPTEAVPEGARFGWRCDFSNLSAEELGVLLIALGQGEPALHLKIGGGKPACYGSVRFELAKLRLRGDVVGDYLSWEGTEVAVDPGSYIQAAMEQPGFVLRRQWQQLSEVLRWPNERDCPGGVY